MQRRKEQAAQNDRQRGVAHARTSMRNHQTRTGVPRSCSANSRLTMPTRRCTSHQRANSHVNSATGRCALSCGCSSRLVTAAASISSAPNAAHATGTTGSATHCERVHINSCDSSTWNCSEALHAVQCSLTRVCWRGRITYWRGSGMQPRVVVHLSQCYY